MLKKYILMEKTISYPDPDEAGVIKIYKKGNVYKVSRIFIFNAQKFYWGQEVRPVSPHSPEISIAEYA